MTTSYLPVKNSVDNININLQVIAQSIVESLISLYILIFELDDKDISRSVGAF